MMARMLIISFFLVLLGFQVKSVKAQDCVFNNSTIPSGNWAVGVPYIEFNISFSCPDNNSTREYFVIQSKKSDQNSTWIVYIMFYEGNVHVLTANHSLQYEFLYLNAKFKLPAPNDGDGKITFNITHFHISDEIHYSYEMNFIFCPTKLYDGVIRTESERDYAFGDLTYLACIEGVLFNTRNQQYVTDSIIAQCNTSAKWQINDADRLTCKPGHLLDFRANESISRVGEVVVLRCNDRLYWDNELIHTRNVTLSSVDHGAVVKCGNETKSPKIILNVTFPPNIHGSIGDISLTNYIKKDQNCTNVNFTANPTLTRNQINITGNITWLKKFYLTISGILHTIHMEFNKTLSPQETYGAIFSISSPEFSQNLDIDITIRLREITTEQSVVVSKTEDSTATPTYTDYTNTPVLIAAIVCPLVLIIIVVASVVIYLRKHKLSKPKKEENDNHVYEDIDGTELQRKYYENTEYENVIEARRQTTDKLQPINTNSQNYENVTIHCQSSIQEPAGGNYEMTLPQTRRVDQYENIELG